MYTHELHDWDLPIPEARALQERLATQVSETPPREFHPRYIAGADMSHRRGSPWLYGAVVVWDRATDAVVEQTVAKARARFPYVPGFLSFREGPVVLEAFRKLKRNPDAALFDAQGRAHPRALGLACHMGLWLDLPSVGCAKSRLCGEHAEPGKEPGRCTALRFNGCRIGTVLRTRRASRPIYISVGHHIDLPTAEDLVQSTLRGYRLPEPTRLAHSAVNVYRRSCENH